ncbi:NAD(P)-dependent oxidoreductase [Dactylosporangium salmoneum]|uniref:NAD-dependent epimerase/dehydratase domain-containing protein n=1 Tax=Dactylosporangium salmoneum TaxID=53361 RepID=A0ABN3HUL2_9ACTN
MNVLVIGGSGRVGAMLLGPLARTHHVTVADRVPPGPGIAFRLVDVADFGGLAAAMAGQDAVVYLAMGPNDGWGDPQRWAPAHFAVNVTGLYLALQAAARAGVRTFLHASTASVFEDYFGFGAELEHRAPDATDAYGLSKRLGEQVAEAAAREHGLAVASLRLCGPLPDDEWRAYDGWPDPHVMTAGSDVAAAFLAALRVVPAHGPGYRTYCITGDHDGRFIDAGPTRRALGWAPLARREDVAGPATTEAGS